MFLDGDNLRHGLNQDLAFSELDREENIRRVSHVAALGFHHGNVVLGSFISPYARDRQLARSLVPEGRFFEIHVKCDLEVLKQRDPKGLYAKAIRGEIPNFTGISAPYEVPENPELVIETDSGETPLTLANMVLKTLADHGIIQKVEASEEN
ncbi:Adenylylsulfate kinase [Fragilaria crotonensis]|nr:Adenylylsulfate kinase [Fragilaria crotonensis]